MMYVCVCEFHMNERMRWLQDGIHGLPCEAAHASRSLGLLSLWQEQARTDCEGTRNIKAFKASLWTPQTRAACGRSSATLCWMSLQRV